MLGAFPTKQPVMAIAYKKHKLPEGPMNQLYDHYMHWKCLQMS